MPVESLNCPNCGAPLRQPAFDNSWLCLYCNSLIRVETAPDDQSRAINQTTVATPQVSLQSSLDADAMADIKQLLISGQRQAAIQRYQHLSSLDIEQAQRTIDRMATDISINTIFHQQLTTGGIATVLLSLVLLPASLVAWGLGLLNPWLAWLCAGLAGFQLFVYWRAAMVTIRYWNAPVARATTLNFTPLGTVNRGRLSVHTFLVLLEVNPPNQLPFQAQVVLPVRAQNVAHIHRGAIIQVKYLPDKPDSVIFHQS